MTKDEALKAAFANKLSMFQLQALFPGEWVCKSQPTELSLRDHLHIPAHMGRQFIDACHSLDPARLKRLDAEIEWLVGAYGGRCMTRASAIACFGDNITEEQLQVLYPGE